MPYFRKAKMFGDGDNGYAIQVYSIWWGRETGEIDTGISLTWTRENRHDSGSTVCRRGDMVGTAKELIDAWAAENGKEPLRREGAA